MDQISSIRAAPVVHIITDAGPHPYFRTLVEAGEIDPATMCIGCVGPAGALQDDMHSLGVNTFALGARSRAEYPWAVVQLARMLRRLGAPVLQSHLVDGALVGLTAARLARTPVAVFTAHHSHELPFHGRKLVLVDRLCAGPLCDHVIAPSEQLADTLIRFTHVDPSKIAVVHHGFDLDRLDPSAIDRGPVRRRWGLENTLVFGAVGRIYALKNYRSLIMAFSRAFADVAAARLMIVGPGDPSHLQQFSRQLGIADRIIFTGPQADVPSTMAAFDVFVHPALAESFGMVIIEAMAMAKPVLSTRVGIAPEVIEPGQNGVLASDGSVGALTAGLRGMMDNQSQWSEWGAAARARVSGFSAHAMSDHYIDLYDTWLQRSSRERKWIR